MKNSGTFKVCQAGGMEKPISCTMAGISKVEVFCPLQNSVKCFTQLMLFTNSYCFVMHMAD